MKRWIVLLALSGMAAGWSQTLNLSSLEKLAAKASQKDEVNLSADQLHAAMQLLPQSERDKQSDSVKRLVSGLESVTVRNFEFDKAGLVQDSDLEPVRAQLAKLGGWEKIVDSKEKHEHAEVYMLTQDGKTAGIAVISLEPKELSVVLVKGAINLSDLQGLHGTMGLPSIKIGPKPRTEAEAKADK